MDMELHLVVCVSFAPLPLLFIEGCHGLFYREFSPEPPRTDLGIEWGANTWKMGPRRTDIRSAGRKRWPNHLKLGLEAARWAPMLCMLVMAFLEAV